MPTLQPELKAEVETAIDALAEAFRESQKSQGVRLNPMFRLGFRLGAMLERRRAAIVATRATRRDQGFGDVGYRVARRILQAGTKPPTMAAREDKKAWDIRGALVHWPHVAGMIAPDRDAIVAFTAKIDRVNNHGGKPSVSLVLNAGDVLVWPVRAQDAALLAGFVGRRARITIHPGYVSGAAYKRKSS